MATKHRSNRIASRTARRLDDFAELSGRGYAYTDTVGFDVGRLASGRQSFSPDAPYYLGLLLENLMCFIEGAPTLAVEVRSENDYGDATEEAVRLKRADYFAAGTLVEWDVDPVDEVICAYRGPLQEPVAYCRGDQAEAEPAVAGWTAPVNWTFD